MNQTDLQQIGELLDQKLDQKFQENNKILKKEILSEVGSKLKENNEILKKEIFHEIQKNKEEIITGICEFIDEQVLPNFDRYMTEHEVKRYADQKYLENKDELKAHDKRIIKLENVVLKKMPTVA